MLSREESPPRIGKPPIIPKNVFKMICQLVASTNCIDQENCDPNRMNRVEMRSEIMPIVNAWLEKNGEQPLNDVPFL